MGWLKRRWNRLPSPEEQQEIVNKCQTSLTFYQTAVNSQQFSVTRSEEALTELIALVEAFEQEYASNPDEVVQQAEIYANEVRQLDGEIEPLTGKCMDRRLYLEDLLFDACFYASGLGIGSSPTNRHWQVCCQLFVPHMPELSSKYQISISPLCGKSVEY